MRKLTLLFVLLSVSGFAFAQSDTVSGNNTTKKTEDVITQPEFKGGIEKMYQYITDNFQYPEEAQRRSVNGKIEVEFTVEKSGDITYVPIPFRILRRKSVWGTYNVRSRSIIFNLALSQVPLECVQYVVLHEMTHQYVHAHNAEFYQRMSAFMPDWKQRRKALKSVVM